jgi:phasin family protein
MATRKTKTVTKAKVVKRAAPKRTAKPAAVVKPQATPVEAAVKSVEQAVEATQVQVEKAVEATQVQVEKASDQTRATIDEVLAFNKQNYDAMMAAGDIYMKGVEAFNAALIESAQKSVAAGLANTQAVLAAQSLQEVVGLQNDFARRAFDDAVAETAKLSELTTKVANEAVKPITVQVQKTVESFVKTAA